MQRHVEHGERHLRHALVPHVGEALLAGVVHRGRVSERDLAPLGAGDQLLQQDRHHLEPNGHEGEAQRPAHAAAFQLQVDQQEGAPGEAADAGVEHPPDRGKRAADADAGDFDCGWHQ